MEENEERYVGELAEFISMPSVSAMPEHAADVRRAAEWVLAQARHMGFSGAFYDTPGHPIVLASLCQAPGAPTVIFYSHYDVQPAGDPEEWQTHPFEPSIRDGAIYARGAADDKGQLFTILKAIESIIAAEGKLPLNVRLLFEGEEEIGSPHLGAFVAEHRDALKADAVLMTDVFKYSKDLPAIYFVLKGSLILYLDVDGPKTNLHSGQFGGAVANPATALAQIIATLKDADGRITIQGFYDLAWDLEPWERDEIDQLPYDENVLERYMTPESIVPEAGYSALECMLARPTLDVNGLWGGATRDELRTVIPASAGALISMRLVPDQDPEVIFKLFEAHVHAVTPPGVRANLRKVLSIPPVSVSRKSSGVRAASEAIELAFGRRPALVRSGGSLGAVVPLWKVLGIEDIVITGWSDPECGEHGPDEHFSLDNFRRGMVATAEFMYAMAETRKAAAHAVPRSTGAWR